MRKILGFALAMLCTSAMAAAAEEGDGRSIILDDGATITVAAKPLTDLAPGDHVPAMFEVTGQSRATGSELRSTMGEGPVYGTQMDSIQAE